MPVPRELHPKFRELQKSAGRIYSKIVFLVRKTYKRKGFWIFENAVKKFIALWIRGAPVHAPSKQAVVEEYFDALKTCFTGRKSNSGLKLPFRTSICRSFTWKNIAVKLFRGGTLRLPFGNGAEPWYTPTILSQGLDIRRVEIVYNKRVNKRLLYVAKAGDSSVVGCWCPQQM